MEQPKDDQPAEPEEDPAPEEDEGPDPFSGSLEDDEGAGDDVKMISRVKTYSIFMEVFTSGFKKEDMLVKLSADFREDKNYKVFGAVDGVKFFPYRLCNTSADYCLVLRYEEIDDMKVALTKTIPQFFEDSEREFDKNDFILMGNYMLYINGEFEDFRRTRLQNVFRNIILENKDT
jgi:hypothetical protein